MRILLIILLTFNLFSCSFLSDLSDDEDETLLWSAERLYSEAKGKLDSGYYSAAVDYYHKIESRYPFGVYAQQSLIDLAYAYYKDGQFEPALSSCERFLKLYPQNKHVDYIYYLKGLINFNKGKGIIRRYLPIDEALRDPSSALSAFQNFSELIKLFPNSKYVEDAKQRMQYLRNNLARNEIHVANYYMSIGSFVAAANRATYVIEHYSKTPFVADALEILAKSYRILGLEHLTADAARVIKLNKQIYPETHKQSEK